MVAASDRACASIVPANYRIECIIQVTRLQWQAAYRLIARQHPAIAAKIAAAGKSTDADWFDVVLGLGELRALLRAVRGSEIEGAVWELVWVEDLEQHWR